MILPLSTALLRSLLEGWLQFGASQYKREMGIPDRVQQRPTNVRKQHLSCEESLRELRLLSLEKTRLRGILPMSTNT